MTITPATSNSPQVCARCYAEWLDGRGYAAACFISPFSEHYHVTTYDQDERICCSCFEQLKAELEVSE